MRTYIYLQNGKVRKRAPLRMIDRPLAGAGTQCDAGRKERASGGKERKRKRRDRHVVESASGRARNEETSETRPSQATKA